MGGVVEDPPTIQSELMEFEEAEMESHLVYGNHRSKWKRREILV